MFKVIEPPFHRTHKVLKNALQDLLKGEQDFTLPSEVEERATFLVAENKTHGVFGGAVIYPQKGASSLDHLPGDTTKDTVIKMTSAFFPKKKKYWAAQICLSLDHGSCVAETLQAHCLCHSFYFNLYSKFVALGKREGIDYLAYALRLDDTYNTNSLSTWSCRIEINLADKSYEYTHGILSLRGKPFNVHESWK